MGKKLKKKSSKKSSAANGRSNSPVQSGPTRAERLVQALKYFRQHKDSQRKVCKMFNIPRTTFDRALAPKPEDHDEQQKKKLVGRAGNGLLTHAEEDAVVDHLLQIAALGFPLTRAQGTSLLIKLYSSIQRPLTDSSFGKNWWSRFLDRHPNLRVKTPKSLSAARAAAGDRETINHFFELVRTKMEEYGVTELYSIDETGFGTSNKDPHDKVLTGLKDIAVKIAQEQHPHITAVMGNSSEGDVLPTLTIFKGKRIVDWMASPEWSQIPHHKIAVSDEGFINTDLWTKYMESVIHYIRVVKKSTKPVIALVDGHKSHFPVALMKRLMEVLIFLISLPPHASHMIQGMDAGSFPALKAAQRKAKLDWYTNQHSLGNTGIVMTKEHLIGTLVVGYKAAQKSQYIEAGWSRCGLKPWNPNRPFEKGSVAEKAAALVRRKEDHSEEFRTTLEAMRSGNQPAAAEAEEKAPEPQSKPTRVSIPGKAAGRARLVTSEEFIAEATTKANEKKQKEEEKNAKAVVRAQKAKDREEQKLVKAARKPKQALASSSAGALPEHNKKHAEAVEGNLASCFCLRLACTYAYLGCCSSPRRQKCACTCSASPS